MGSLDIIFTDLLTSDSKALQFYFVNEIMYSQKNLISGITEKKVTYPIKMLSLVSILISLKKVDVRFMPFIILSRDINVLSKILDKRSSSIEH